MQKLQLTLILLLITCLSACKDNFPAITSKERCVTVLISEEDESYKGYCRCHEYGWTINEIGRISDSKNYELSKCNKMIGFSPEDSAQIYDWQESIRMWLDRRK